MNPDYIIFFSSTAICVVVGIIGAIVCKVKNDEDMFKSFVLIGLIGLIPPAAFMLVGAALLIGFVFGGGTLITRIFFRKR
jgi:ammonia channel protein AmtB